MLENGMLSRLVSSAHRPGFTARSVKYIANRPAKNMSSLESQTMVPTATMFGRFAGAWLYAGGAVVTVATGGVWQIGEVDAL
jgi:hypothetical protein